VAEIDAEQLEEDSTFPAFKVEVGAAMTALLTADFDEIERASQSISQKRRLAEWDAVGLIQNLRSSLHRASFQL